MDEHQKEERLAASQSFLKSLEQLSETLQEGVEPTALKTPLKKVPQSKPNRPPEVKFDLAALEDAVADIEQFMESQHSVFQSSTPVADPDENQDQGHSEDESEAI